MSIEIKEIKQRIGSTREIQKVTAALQRVASARLGREKRDIAAFRRYAEAFARLLRTVAAASATMDHPILNRKGGEATLLVVFGADRGLCGGFNSMLTEEMKTFVTRERYAPVEVLAVGRVVARRAARLELTVRDAVDQPLTANRTDFLDALVKQLLDGYLTGAFKAIHLLYVQFLSGLRQMPVVDQILPFQLEAASSVGRSVTSFEPEPVDILAGLLPEFIRVSVENAFRNSMASENAARQAAMSRASENAGELIDDLTKTYSRLRQESVTTEMLELVAGGMGAV